MRDKSVQASRVRRRARVFVHGMVFTHYIRPRSRILRRLDEVDSRTYVPVEAWKVVHSHGKPAVLGSKIFDVAAKSPGNGPNRSIITFYYAPMRLEAVFSRFRRRARPIRLETNIVDVYVNDARLKTVFAIWSILDAKTAQTYVNPFQTTM